MTPNMLGLPYILSTGGAGTATTLDQSASRSSARINRREVNDPPPLSVARAIIDILPLGAVPTHRFKGGPAIAALRHPLGQPSYLHGMRGIRREPLDRRYFLAGNIRHLRLARKRASTVDMHHAGAAQAHAAAEFGAGELELLANNPKQRRIL